MDDAALVRLLQRRGNLAAQCGDLLLRQPAGGDALRQGLARHVLHDQEVDAVAAVEVVNRGNMRVVQPGQRFRFLPKPSPCCLVAKGAGRQHLEGDVAVEVRVAGAVDLAHAARAKLGGDLIVAQCSSDHSGALMSWLGRASA